MPTATMTAAPVAVTTTERAAIPTATNTITRSPAVTTSEEIDTVQEELPEVREATGTPTAADRSQMVEAFVEQLEEAYGVSPFNADTVRVKLRPLLDRDFSFTLYPGGRPPYLDSHDQVLGHLSFGLFRPLAPVFIAEKIEDHLPPSVTPEAFFMGEQPLEAVIYSTGWGQDGTAEALLFLTRDQGTLRWSGLALSRDNFAPLPDLETMAPPPGLVYRLDDEWWQVDPSGEARLLLAHPGPLSFNPSTTHALFAEDAAQSLTLFDFTNPGLVVSRTLPIDFSLMHGSWDVPWMDEQTAILLVTESGAALTQGTTGQMALLDSLSGQLQLLAPQVYIYTQPAPTENGAIFYDALPEDGQFGTAVWRAGMVTPLGLAELAGTEREPFGPVPSPGGKMVAARGAWPPDSNLTGYWVFDLEREAAHAVLGYTPPGTDAILPPGIFWHPSGEWLALEPQTGDPLQAGVWIMHPDGSEKQFLGVGTANPVWMEEGLRLLFNVTMNGEQRLQLLDLEKGERFWVEAPHSARPVQ